MYKLYYKTLENNVRIVGVFQQQVACDHRFCSPYKNHCGISFIKLTNYQHDEDPYNSTQPIPKSK